MLTELPENFGPILVKEMRQGLRRPIFVYSFLSIQALAVLALSAEFLLSYDPPDRSPRLLEWALEETGYFWWLVMAFCGVLMPLTGSFMMTEELDQGNHEILQLAQTSRWQIVRGKFLILWGLSALTLFSLLPYIIVRYFLGGVGWVQELTDIGTVLCVAALVSSASLAISAFKNVSAKVGIALIYLFLMPLGIVACLSGGWVAISGSGTSKFAWVGLSYYHFAAIVAIFTYVSSALLLARSRLRLAFLAFEPNSSGFLITLIAISPVFIGFFALFTCGFGSPFGALAFLFLIYNTDVTPKAPKNRPAKPPNIPMPLTQDSI